MDLIEVVMFVVWRATQLYYKELTNIRSWIVLKVIEVMEFCQFLFCITPNYSEELCLHTHYHSPESTFENQQWYEKRLFGLYYNAATIISIIYDGYNTQLYQNWIIALAQHGHGGTTVVTATTEAGRPRYAILTWLQKILCIIYIGNRYSYVHERQTKSLRVHYTDRYRANE